MSVRKLMALIVLVGVGIMLLRPVSGPFGSAPPVRLPAVVERAGPTTILVLGLDRRGTEAARSDTMVVARVAPGQPPALLSIPRDLWVTIPGHGDDRINTAYTWGELSGGDGVGLARRTVEQNLGVRVDRVAVVDFACFQQAIDAAGGITVEVDQRLVDPNQAPVGRAGPLEFTAGLQRFDGAEALQYARVRAPDSDFGRMRRQQQVVVALGERARDPQIALQVANTFARRCPSSGLDLTAADLLTLGALAARGGPPKVRLIDESMVSPTTLPSGAQVLLPRWEAIRPLVTETLGNAR